MTAPTYDLGRLHGGLRLEAHKAQSTSSGLEYMPVPPRLVLPLDQHIGERAQPVVTVGERVLKGQVIAEHTAGLGAHVHASTSGTVIAIGPWPVSRRRGDPGPCIIIESDGADSPVKTVDRTADYGSLSREELASLILEGGLVGLGGAVFPTAHKITQAQRTPLDMLILNGVECEPWISCDDMLMREHADAVVEGARILLHTLGIDMCFLAVESDKPVAIEALLKALRKAGDERVVLKQVPTIYPSGAEDQLVQLVTNREVPTRGLPTDVGCLVQNVGTAAAVHDWVARQVPLISRITTVTGPGVARPVNLRVRLGTTVADVIEHAGGYTPAARQLVIGGSMTGKSLSTDQVPVVKATNCILVLGDLPAVGSERACIRCGECFEVCPIQLLPQQIHWHARADNEDQLREHGLVDCIECGCCDLVCPSHIPLTANFRIAKARIRELDDERARAERARRRFEARSQRLEQEAEAERIALKQQKDRAKSSGAEAIAEIMRRRQDKEED